MKRKILSLCLVLTMLFGMMSGMSLTAFADEETTVKSTDDTKARAFTGRNFTGGDDAFFSDPDNGHGANDIEGMQGFTGGSTLEYDNISFSGDERTFSIDYSIHGQYYGNFNVYLDNMDAEHLILAARNVEGHGYGWGAQRTVALNLQVRPSKGIHKVILEGLDTTAKIENPEEWGKGTSGFSAFRFVEGEWPTTAPATNEFLALDYDSASYTPGRQDMGWNGETVYAATDFKDNQWLEFDNIEFSGDEVTFSGVFMHGGSVESINYKVYVDSISDENLIAVGDNVSTGTGWGGATTIDVDMMKPVTGTHSVIVVGLPLVSKDTTAWDGNLVAFYSFTFAEGDWPVFATDEILASSYKTASDGISKNTYWYDGENADAVQGVEGIAYLTGGRTVTYEDIVFSGKETDLSFDYSIQTANYQGNFNVYVDSIADENLIAAPRNISGAGWSWGRIITRETPLLKPVTAGTHTLIFEGLDNTLVASGAEWAQGANGIGLFRFVEGSFKVTVSDLKVTLDGTTVDPFAYDYEWVPGSYTVEITTEYVPGTEKLYGAVYDADEKLIAVDLSAETGNGKKSITLDVPEGVDLAGAFMKIFVWESNSIEPLYTKTSEFRIGCIGDSITEGFPVVSYVPTIKSSMPQVKEVYNFGKSGATIGSTLAGDAHLAAALEAQCSVYTIMLGTNEANNSWTWTPEQFEENNFVETYKEQYRTLIDKVQEANPSAEIFLVTCPKIIADNEQGSPADAALDTYVIPAIKAVASEYGLDVIDLNAEMADYVAAGNALSSWGYVDFLHFSADGAAKLGKFFAQELNRFLGL